MAGLVPKLKPVIIELADEVGGLLAGKIEPGKLISVDKVLVEVDKLLEEKVRAPPPPPPPPPPHPANPLLFQSDPILILSLSIMKWASCCCCFGVGACLFICSSAASSCCC
eukprot:SAG22_NODE_321_length_12398_cov_3.218392_12_plen_111_part_00